MPPPVNPDLPLGAPTRDVYTVGRLNREARMLLEAGLPPLWVEGEISNFSSPASGHWYFSLKDRDAQIRCAMFRARNLGVGFRPKEGQLLQARGRVSLYEPRGDYQLIVEQLEDAGEGALKREFEKLKARLAAEGLFAFERKRPLPAIPKRIAVVTSPTGAAIRDILHILARRFPAAAVLIYPVPVQGSAAAPAIVAAIDLANARADCDVLILARGGGSLEDLWSFNDEAVARAILRSGIPVVTGIGHEVDFTIADFVADSRAPTPSGAAQLVVPDRQALLAQLLTVKERLRLAAARQLARGMEQYASLARRLNQAHPGSRLTQQAQRLDELQVRLHRLWNDQHGAQRRALAGLAQRLDLQGRDLLAAPATQSATLDLRLRNAWPSYLNRLAQRLALAMRGLDGVSPLATLQRGFAIVTDAGGAVITDAARLKPGDEIEARLATGRISAIVK
ncbi:MAG: exodeoxyribonuclease VII large subunit [Pseudomonadota bacterium]